MIYTLDRILVFKNLVYYVPAVLVPMLVLITVSMCKIKHSKINLEGKMIVSPNIIFPKHNVDGI